jgi:DNA-binding MarR family transcriptional regulator
VDSALILLAANAVPMLSSTVNLRLAHLLVSPYVRLFAFSNIKRTKSISKKLSQQGYKTKLKRLELQTISPCILTALVLITVTDESSTAPTNFSIANYRQLAELRFRIRQYLQFSEQVARNYGIEPQQHQLMLTIKGLPDKSTPTVSALANRLCLRHHSTVELINRLVERGAAVRKPSTQDRRQVLVELTPLGEELLTKLSADHDKELQTHAPSLVEQLASILNQPAMQNGDGSSNSSSQADDRTASHPEPPHSDSISGEPAKQESASV